MRMMDPETSLVILLDYKVQEQNIYVVISIIMALLLLQTASQRFPTYQCPAGRSMVRYSVSVQLRLLAGLVDIVPAFVLFMSCLNVNFAAKLSRRRCCVLHMTQGFYFSYAENK